jgi:hypothetical protein
MIKTFPNANAEETTWEENVRKVEDASVGRARTAEGGEPDRVFETWLWAESRALGSLGKSRFPTDFF